MNELLNLLAAKIPNNIYIPVPITVYKTLGIRRNIGAMTCADKDME
jgi:hypothetical protein